MKRPKAALADIQLFDAAGNSPEMWALKAYQLVAAANLCHQRAERIANRPLRPRFFPDWSADVYLMLYSFAIESMLKALALAKGSRVAKQGTLAGALKTHDLVALWAEAKMPQLTADEKFFLHFLRSYVEVGRYPVRSKAAPPDNRLVLTSQLKPYTLHLFARIDRALRKLRPSLRSFVGPPRLATRGLQRIQIK